MKKNYPLSNKALKAFLAASIAFTPVVTTSALTPLVVSANTVDSSIDRFKVIYKDINTTDTEQDYIDEARALIANPSTNWDTILGSTVVTKVDGALGTGKAAEMGKAIAHIIYADSETDFSTKVTAFRGSFADEFDTLFGADVTIDDLFTFFSNFETNLEVEIIGQMLLNDIPSYEQAVSDALDTTINNGFLHLDGKLFEGLGVGLDGLFDIKDRINLAIDPEGNANSALMAGLLRSKGASITGSSSLVSGSTSTYGMTVKINTTTADLTNDVVWVSSNTSVADFGTGNTLTAKAAGTTTIKAQAMGLTLLTKDVTITAPTSGGGTTTPPTEPTDPTPGTGDNVVELPEGSTEVVETGNEVATKVNPDKVADIANQVTEEKSVVGIVLPEAAAGKTVKATVPANLFTEVAKKNKNAQVEVSTKDGAYRLPVNQINMDSLTKDLGVSESDVEISISVNVVEAPAGTTLNLASKVIEFKVTASSTDGKTKKDIVRFSQYVERGIVSDKVFNANTSVAVRLNEDGTFTAIPTVFDGKNATIKSLTNSKYVIVENSKTFTDVDGGKNWAEAHIEKLASKYIINGKSETSYDPSADITRGEFAALISRSLGLVATDTTAVNFVDVSSQQAINKNGEIAAAVEAGIIKGKTDGKFYPGEKITRADAAIMISRAMDYVNADPTGLNTSKDLTDLTDYQKVGAASKDAVEKVMQADIMSGFGNGSFGPEATTKRDQMAKILDKFLQFVKFVN